MPLINWPPALQETKFCQLAGVVTGSPEKGQKWAKQYGSPKEHLQLCHHGTARGQSGNRYRLCCHAKRDTRRNVIAAAQAGKHVISEKPFTTSVAEAEAAIAACRSARVKLSIGYRLHFDPYHQELMRLARDPILGLHESPGEFQLYYGTQSLACG